MKKSAKAADGSAVFEKEERPKEQAKPKKTSKRAVWTIKITIITLIIAIIVSFLTEITTNKANMLVSIAILLTLIVVSIVFDVIGVAFTSCDQAPVLSMAARKVKGAKLAVKLLQNAEKVSNICTDVIGDICGIVSGGAAAVIVIKFAVDNPDMYLYSILMSSIVSAVTVGGKAFFKTLAMKKSKEVVLSVSRFLTVFYKFKK